MVDVVLPSGLTVQNVPEGTSKAVLMQKVIASGIATEDDFLTPAEKGARQVAQETGIGEAALVSVGKGFTDVGRGIKGLLVDTPEQSPEAFAALEKERPITTAVGEITGQVAPFLVPALGVGQIVSFPLRVLAAAGLGGTEGAILSSAEGRNILEGAGVGTVIGGTLEAIFPVLGRVGRQIFSRIKGTPPKGALFDRAGEPTKEMVDALDEAGLTIDDLVDQASEQLKAAPSGTIPEQAARQATFAQEAIPATTGEITQDFGQQATEARLLESQADRLADPFRSFKLAQSEAIQKNLQDALPEASVDVGDAIKDALVGRKSLLSSQKNALYREAAETSENIGQLPIIMDVSNLADAATKRRISRLSPQASTAVDDLLVEFGLESTPEAIEEFVKSGGEIIPLSVGNFEEFRQAINLIERSDTTGAISVVTGPLKRALDEEGDLLSTALEKGGVTDTGILDKFKEARKTVRQIKTEFSPQAVTGRLIDAKRDGVTPVIEASKVYKEILKNPEFVNRTIDSLNRAGAKGKQAISSLQTAVILDLLDAGFSTQSRKIQGVKTFNPNAFNRRLEGIGSKNLNKIFSNRPELRNKLKNLEKIAADLQPPSGAVPKGSASVILDAMNKLGFATISTKIPGAALLRETVQNISENSATRKQVIDALSAKPEQLRLVNHIEQQFPSLASALGIVGISQIQESE